MSGWANEYLQMIEDCENRESRLSDWERGFVASIADRLQRDQPLSLRQTEKLESIWERVTNS